MWRVKNFVFEPRIIQAWARAQFVFIKKLKSKINTPLDKRLKAAVIADSSFQSKQWQLQGVAVAARKSYFFHAWEKLQC